MFATLLENGRAAEREAKWDLALEQYEAALSEVAAEGEPKDVCEILRRIGIVHQNRSDLDLALEVFEASLAIAELNELDWHQAAALIGIAANNQLRGEISQAFELYSRARIFAVRSGDDQIAAAVEQNVAIVANIRGDVSTALQSYGSALERFQRLGYKESAAGVLGNMAMSYVDLEEWQSAEACFDEATTIAQEIGDQVIVGRVGLNKAELYLKRQQYESAREACEQALVLFGSLKAKARMGEVYKFYGILYRETSRLEKAGLHLAMSLGLAESSQDRLLEAEAQTEWALVHVEEGRLHEAIRRLNKAYRLFHGMEARRDLLAIEKHLNRLQQSYLPTVQNWGSETVEARDPLRAGRTERIAQYSSALGEQMGLSGWDLTWLRAGASVHDVGNSAVPMEVLGKPGALTRGEREMVQSHTVLGDAMIGELDFPTEIRQMVRSHHERWDGKGYPDRMVGEEIPLNARILSVADSFDALTSDRSWRKAYTQADALQIMEQESGTLFDPEIFGSFRGLVTAGAMA